MSKTLFLSFLVLLSFCSREEDPVLPLETMKGEETFGMMVNSNIWLPSPDPGISGCTALKADYSPSKNQFILVAGNQGEQIHFLFEDIHSGQYNSVDLTSESVKFYETDYTKFLLDLDSPCLITITKFDPVNEIVSGTFYFKLTNPDVSRTKIITEGRFDVRFTTCRVN